jgi:hypothetical protein
MKAISDAALAEHFIGWQRRIRQMAMRDYGGQPLGAMRPRVSTRQGEVVVGAMTVVMVPKEPDESTAFLRFQVMKTNEAQKAYDSVIKYLQAEHFSSEVAFSDELTALFPAASATAERLVSLKQCLLVFEQWSQAWRLPCRVKLLKADDEAREHTLWHNRVFNPMVGNDALVLGFRPDWKRAQADPMP